MSNIRPIETILAEQRRAVEIEISRLKQELEKIDALMRRSTPSAPPIALTEEVVEIDTRSLTERAREQIQEILPEFEEQGYTVAEIAAALSLRGVHIKNKMLSTILWRMADKGKLEKIGPRRQTRWRAPQKSETSDAGASDASTRR